MMCMIYYDYCYYCCYYNNNNYYCHYNYYWAWGSVVVKALRY